MSFPGAQPQSPLPYAPPPAVTHDALPPSSPGSYGYPAGAPHPDHSFTLPKGFVAVVVVGLVYAIGRATGLALQFSVVTGDRCPGRPGRRRRRPVRYRVALRTRPRPGAPERRPTR
ncbi:hypothetical protein C6V83_15080 [Gordonia iterans]|uniref:Uncharacterized protein n=1 Tax=Gordonia iterans TaxID=1004901 RepID=A0A2S0KI58_9ACTN|nr:hypothetical protein [Gordonia iterans]AVM01370.1 hypothetical protein C6V83_15080 [Gordonia iterans]